MKKKGVMLRSRGFTLVELLVVIAIIALLMAVLLPGLSRARIQARTVVCKSGLKQWSMMLTMYAQDNSGKLLIGWNGGQMWMVDLMRYYQGEKNILLCPLATKLRSKFPPTFLFSTTEDQTFLAWGKFGENGYFTPPWGKTGQYGSYGINAWLHNALDTGVTGTYDTPQGDRKNYWRTIDVKNAYLVPAFGDCMWDGAEPRENDNPPPSRGVQGSDMTVFCLDRHNGGPQMAFMDGSVRKVGLRELWKLKWHRYYNTKVKPPTWPAWMIGYKDYKIAE